MKTMICCLILVLQITTLVSATSRPFAPNDGGVNVNKPVTGHSPECSQASSSSKLGSQLGSKQVLPQSPGMEGLEAAELNEEAYYEDLSKIGSSPPSCEHKCYSCTPCQAIQVPTTSKTHKHLNVNYANYEPEGWKCKCGPSFYSP